jgi:cell division protein FtsB
MRRPRRWIGWAIAFAAGLFGPGLYDMARLAWRERALDEQLAALEARRHELTSEQERLEKDPTYVEGLIRSTFKVAKEGELVIPVDSSTSRGR